jgi:sugar/nucleoside kinase (ribokinase family)
MNRRKNHSLRPIFVWEPTPALCIAEELENCKEAVRFVDVVSPNHQELAAFFSLSAMSSKPIDKAAVEKCAGELLSSGLNRGCGGCNGIVVRAGKDGCYVSTATETLWLPAYHFGSEKVVDPTGGGNTFLGGLAIALARGMDLKEAALWGSVAASFAIEQVGMPKLELRKSGDGELWNDTNVDERLREFRSRCQ